MAATRISLQRRAGKHFSNDGGKAIGMAVACYLFLINKITAMKNILLIVATCLVMGSCTKDTIAPETTNLAATPASSEQGVEGAVRAVVEWTADPAVDGFGWVLRLRDNQMEIPRNLPDGFKKNGLPVRVVFEKTDERFPCRCVEPVYYVEITDIQPEE